MGCDSMQRAAACTVMHPFITYASRCFSVPDTHSPRPKSARETETFLSRGLPSREDGAEGLERAEKTVCAMPGGGRHDEGY